LKRDHVNYFLVGLVTLVALLLLLASLWAITGRSGAVDRYLVHYRNVTGIGYGTAVFYQGYRIGQVDAITPEQKEGKTRFRVDFSVNQGWQIPSDSVAAQMSSGLLADMFIGIREGEATTMLKPETEIAGLEGGDIFGAVAELAGEVTDLTRNKLTPLVDRLGRSIDAVSGKIESGGPALVDEAIILLEKLNQGAESINRILGTKNQESLSSLLGNADNASKNLRKITDALRGTGGELDKLIVGAGDLLSDNRPEIDSALGDLRITLAALAERVDAITYNLESASRHVDEFTRELRKQPNRLLFSPKDDEPDASVQEKQP
jgi:phospholipid/cholesterol/gamma-HCH transport system substrate-binding protein